MSCWNTFHFKEFQIAAIGKKLKTKLPIARSLLNNIFVSDIQCDFRHAIGLIVQ